LIISKPWGRIAKKEKKTFELWAVKGDSFEADKPRAWSEKQIGGIVNLARNVDLAPDGKRIVALMPVETVEAQKAQNQMTFLMNFSDELQRKVPVGK
jgi:hypothetical protein